MSRPDFMRRSKEQSGFSGQVGIPLGRPSTSDREARCSRPMAGFSHTGRGSRCKRNSSADTGGASSTSACSVPGIETRLLAGDKGPQLL